MLFEAINTNKEALHNDLIKVSQGLNEDMIVQQERIHELGVQLYQDQIQTKNKFQELSKI